MTNFIVSEPVWMIYYIKAETKKEAIELAHKESVPHDTYVMEDVSTEVKEEAMKGDSDYIAEN